ncbi:MAG: RagB/SusD family nutrient uptake outer membrane protein [Prevotellaceae bacterium]|nr:RagB/SusD family nutrient uptake outer membrane protein [Prevotellaceae bacterium]
MKKINIKSIMLMSAMALTFASCDDLFDPAIENQGDIETRSKDATYAQGLIGSAYSLLPYSYQGAIESDYATDDAICNDVNNNFARMISTWSAQNDPVSQWTGRYHGIQYANLMLENVDNVKWAGTEILNQMYIDHFKGEAYGMRALQMIYLLRGHAGMVDGKLLGVPIHNSSEDGGTDYNQSRPEFKECVEAIVEDLNKAIELLPYEDKNVTAAEIPAKYKGAGVDDYNRAFGSHMLGRINGKICAALKSEILLFAASPAFSLSGITWAEAAKAAADVLKPINGVAGLDPIGNTWYCNVTEMDNMTSSSDPKEIIWRGDMQNHHVLEGDNYPPSLSGNGRTNPTQNLVDAFPMSNGYPITVNSQVPYDANNPYANRDPRLALYILYNGQPQGVNSTPISTGADATTLDGINKENGKSTRTGYSMRKLMRSDVNLNPATDQKHYVARIRYTEIFLNYAEACNEAYGPTSTEGGCGSAYDVVKAIRQRGGIVNDAYLESIKNNKDEMRKLIRNERRIELCFEGKRLNDLRRWGDAAAMQVDINGMEINGGTYKVVKVATLGYKPYMIYGPIPYTEVIKWSNLQQNDGWEGK